MKFLDLVVKYKWALAALALVATVAVASVLYSSLSDKYMGDGFAEIPGGGVEQKPVADSDPADKPSSGETAEKPDGSEEKPNGETEKPNGGGTSEPEGGTESDTTPDKEEGESETPSQGTGDATTLEFDFTALDYNGNTVKLSDYVGKPVVLNFWATWCGYCKQEMPDFDRAAKDFPDVTFLMVNATDGVSETVASAKKYVEDEGYENFTVLFDTKSEAQITYGINAYPTTFFIDETGTPRLYAQGAMKYDNIVSALERMKEMK